MNHDHEPTDYECMQQVAGTVVTFEFVRKGPTILSGKRLLELRLPSIRERRALPVYVFDSWRYQRRVMLAIMILLPLMVAGLVAAMVFWLRANSANEAFTTAVNDVAHTRSAMQSVTAERDLLKSMLEDKLTVSSVSASALANTNASLVNALSNNPTAMAIKTAPTTVVKKIVPQSVKSAWNDAGVPQSLLRTPAQALAPPKEASSAVISAVPPTGSSVPSTFDAEPVIAPNPRAIPNSEAAKQTPKFVSKTRLGLKSVAPGLAITESGQEIRVGQQLPTGERVLDIRVSGSNIEIATDQRTVIVLP